MRCEQCVSFAFRVRERQWAPMGTAKRHLPHLGSGISYTLPLSAEAQETLDRHHEQARAKGSTACGVPARDADIIDLKTAGNLNVIRSMPDLCPDCLAKLGKPAT